MANVVCLLGVLLCAVALVGGLSLVSREIAASQRRALASLMDALEDASGETDVKANAGLAGLWVKGRLKQRAVAVEFTPGQEATDSIASYTVDVEHAAGDFELTRAFVHHWLADLLGVVGPTDQQPVGADLALRGGANEAVRPLFQQDALAQRARTLMDRYGFWSVELRDGRLRVEHAVHGIYTTNARGVLEELCELAALCERRPLGPGVTVKPRFAWTGGDSTPRCPYCREPVDAEQAGLVDACDRCGTLHHRACLDEAGGCTIFGCGPRDRARARAT